MLKFICERQCVVVLIEVEIFSHLILEVANVSAGFVPACHSIICLFVGVDRHFHAIIEHRVWLVVVHYVKLDRDSCSSVLDLEVKPLGVAESVGIILHQ